MSILIHITYTGQNGCAKRFAQEMIRSGIVGAIRSEDGNERYDYFFPMDDPESVLLIDAWRDQQALDLHHSLPLMGQIAQLREKYDLHMQVERFSPDLYAEASKDAQFIRK